MFLSSFNWYWPEWNHRAKISIGILEFFLDIVSFNPNDDFGLDSLYLCSPIETSFGYTFKNEAKLINYDNLISQRELRDIMKQRSCQSDLDCVYTDECAARCELSTNTCTSNLVHPQIFNYCKFIRAYLVDNSNATDTLEPVLKSCEQLKWFSNSESNLLKVNEMPLSFEKHKLYLTQSNYWKNSFDYAIVTNKLHSVLWSFIKYSKDPVKTTKKTGTTSTKSTE